MEAADMKVPQSQSETCECDIHVGQTVTCRMMQFYKKKKKKKKKHKKNSFMFLWDPLLFSLVRFGS